MNFGASTKPYGCPLEIANKTKMPETECVAQL